MNYKVIFQTISKALKIEAILLLLPALVALYYHEASYLALLITSAIAYAAGLALRYLSRDNKETAYERESFVMVTLVWVFMSLIGALPFVISREIPSYVDALFETVSGFTTTGATILTDVESLSRGMLFWRSFTHWIGGMGILVFIVMLDKRVQGRTMSILKAEMPGPIVGKLVPKAKDTARALYMIYIAMTLIQCIMLWAGGMPLFESVIDTMSTAGTGGFAIKNNSLQNISAYSQWVITVFMLLFGINFNLYFYALKGHVKELLRSEELRWYLIVFFASFCIVGTNIYHRYNNISDTIRYASFQVSSLMTTTGFSTCDYDTWPAVAKSALLIVMFIGGCAGSTAGGLKITRIIIVCKSIRQELIKLIQPRRVSTVSLEKHVIDQEVVRETNVYFALYALFLSISSIVIMSIEPIDMVSGFSAVTACFSNVGPGFGTIGPSGNFAHFSNTTKLLLSFIMITGRLEIYPVLLSVTLPFRKRH